MRAWFTMAASSAEAGAAEIVIYDEIGKSFWGEPTVSAKQFLDDLDALGDVEQINLRINSPGGDVFDGVAIHNALRMHKAKVTAHIDGLAASIASYIAMAADKIVMPSNAFMLIHNSSGVVFGNADDMRATAADLDRIDKSITSTYTARSSASASKIKTIMKEDRLMDAAEAKELGLVDEVTKPVKMAANFSLRLLPTAAAERFRAETGPGQGDPPPPATEPAAPGDASPALPPAPAPEPAIDTGALIQQGVEAHRAYVALVTDLCTLSGALDRVGHYVRENIPADEVRKDLLRVRAEDQHVRSQHAVAAKTIKPPPTWNEITDKINARKIKAERS